MTTETLYWTATTGTINGLSVYEMLTTDTNTTTSQTVKAFSTAHPTVYVGIRVWWRNSSGTETEITSGTAIAIISFAYSTLGQKTATWSAPQTAINDPNSSIVVRAYYGTTNPPTTAFTTPFSTLNNLNITALNSSTWTVAYYCATSELGGEYLYTIQWGNAGSSIESEIENFSYSSVSLRELSLLGVGK
jgi:hypothetical protein